MLRSHHVLAVAFALIAIARHHYAMALGSSATAVAASSSWVRDASAKLRTQGFVALPSEVSVGSDLVKEVSELCRTRLDSLLDAVDDAGCNVFEQQYSFNEICHRKRLRWDCRMGRSGDGGESSDEGMAAWNALCERAVELATPAILAASGAADCQKVRILMSGAVVSRPGALEQSFHADGEGGLYNIFVPLVDVEESSDGTQFWPGSHLSDPSMEEVLALTESPVRMAEMESPGCQAGGLLLFDYRVIHRGLAAVRERERPVAYVVCTAEDGAQDRKNFPDLSV